MKVSDWFTLSPSGLERTQWAFSQRKAPVSTLRFSKVGCVQILAALTPGQTRRYHGARDAHAARTVRTREPCLPRRAPTRPALSAPPRAPQRPLVRARGRQHRRRVDPSDLSRLPGPQARARRDARRIHRRSVAARCSSPRSSTRRSRPRRPHSSRPSPPTSSHPRYSWDLTRRCPIS